MTFVIGLLICLGPSLGADSGGHAWLLSWLVDLRAANDRRPLVADDLLTRVAAAYSLELLGRGVIDHRDSSGGSVRERARSLGYTTATLGEVLGAGSDLEAIAGAWLASEQHVRILLHEAWNHVGLGIAESGETKVVVAVFSAVVVEDLRVLAAGTVLAGSIVDDRARMPVLLVDTRSISPIAWEPESGSFRFPFDRRWISDSYIRVGYIDGGGGLVVTDVLHPQSDVPGL